MTYQPSIYDTEFSRFLDPLVQGLTPAQRMDVLTRHLNLAEVEGLVPVRGHLVSGTSNGRAVVTGHQPASGARRWWLMGGGALLGLVVLLVVLFGGGDGASSAADTVLTVHAVTVDRYGSTGPVSLEFGSVVIPVKAFDPAAVRTWPVPPPDTVLWGGTTINRVFALNRDKHRAIFDALRPGVGIHVRQADGSIAAYRVFDVIERDRSAVEYTAQRQVGLTLLGMSSTGPERTIVTAVPLDVPVLVTAVDAWRVDVLDVRWGSRSQTATVGVHVTLAISNLDPTHVITTPNILTINDQNGSRVGSVGVPVSSDGITTTIVIDPAVLSGDMIPVTIQHDESGTTAVVMIPVPATESITVVRWVAASYRDDVLQATVLIESDTPVVVPADQMFCEDDHGTRVPLQLASGDPLFVDGRTEVHVECRIGTASGDNLLVLGGSSAVWSVGP